MTKSSANKKHYCYICGDLIRMTEVDHGGMGFSPELGYYHHDCRWPDDEETEESP